MIRELSELGKKIRTENAGKKLVHDAIKDEPFSIDLIIRPDGTFERFAVIEKRLKPAEAITAKKGKARLLLDKAEEVLCYGDESKKHELFIKKLEEYQSLPELKPVLAFYGVNRMNGLDKALTVFEAQVDEKERGGNIAFRLIDKDKRIHEEDSVYEAIIEKYETEQNQKKATSSRLSFCSVCGKTDFPIGDIVHNAIRGVSGDKEPAGGRKLISYNGDHNPYESYDMIGNENCQICTRCAIEYTEGLNWLLSNGPKLKNEKGKEYTAYTNRKSFGFDTVMVFWTRENADLAEIDILDRPNPGEVANLLGSVISGEAEKGKYLESDRFYSCTLSGAAARVAVRDWIETSLKDFQKSIAQWFRGIEIEKYDWDLKKSTVYYSRLYEMAKSGQNDKVGNDVTLSRTASHLWNAALKNTVPPLWILSEVIKRVRVDDKGITPERAALIKLILNRNNRGGFMVLEKLDPENTSTAYVCGQIFAEMESIQRAALGKNLNAGIRERFFSSASLTPATAFGRLARLSNQHLTKLKGEKPGLFVVLDKELGGLMDKIKSYPAIFTLEEQGQFAIGYYHQKQALFAKVKDKPELLEAVEEE
jgi:CRISPR-associated protein Csd1